MQTPPQCYTCYTPEFSYGYVSICIPSVLPKKRTDVFIIFDSRIVQRTQRSRLNGDRR